MSGNGIDDTIPSDINSITSALHALYVRNLPLAAIYLMPTHSSLQTRPSPLLALPAELRNAIYNMLLGSLIIRSPSKGPQ
jgi:hypothetical protein